jgi:rhamnose transport system permease protein
MKMNSKLRKALGTQEFSVFIVLVVIYVIVGLIQPRWFSKNVLNTILLFMPYVLLLGLGEMVIIIDRNVDMSVGSIMGFCAVMCGMIFRADKNFNPFLLCLISMAIGGLLGLLNGVVINKLSLPSVIATMGTGYIFRGAFYIICDGDQIDNTSIPQYITSYSAFHSSAVGIPYLVIFVFLTAILIDLILKKTKLGRNIYFCGDNPNAASLRGIDIKKISTLCFAFAGVCSGLAALAYISRIGYVNPTAVGAGIEFTVIAGVVIGGTSMSGGSGSVLGTVLGVFLLGELDTAITIVGLSGHWQKVIYGLIIVVAVIADKQFRTRMQKALEVGRQ